MPQELLLCASCVWAERLPPPRPHRYPHTLVAHQPHLCLRQNWSHKYPWTWARQAGVSPQPHSCMQGQGLTVWQVSMGSPVTVPTYTEPSPLTMGLTHGPAGARGADFFQGGHSSAKRESGPRARDVSTGGKEVRQRQVGWRTVGGSQGHGLKHSERLRMEFQGQAGTGATRHTAGQRLHWAGA